MLNGDAHYSDERFVQISMNNPTHFFRDRRGFSWTYREVGGRVVDETVVIIPGIRETLNTYFQLIPDFMKFGFRVLSICYLEVETIENFCKGFNDLTCHLGITDIHIIGNDLGGYLGLQLSSFVKKRYNPKSLLMINSYVSNVFFKRSIMQSLGPLGALVGKKALLEEFDTFNVHQFHSEGLLFVSKEILVLSASEASARVNLRTSRPNEIRLPFPEENICVIETSDRLILYPDEYNPSNFFNKARVSLMKGGGEWPHLNAPNDLMQYILVHLQRVSEKIYSTFLGPDYKEIIDKSNEHDKANDDG